MNHMTRFLVIASDGVWEFLSNKRVLDIVEKYYKIKDASAAANKVVETARKCWRRVYFISVNIYYLFFIGG